MPRKRANQSVSSQVASHVICTRARFQSIYDDVAREVAVTAGHDAQPVPFLAVVLDDQQQAPAKDLIAFTRACEAAEQGRWLDKLVRRCVTETAIELGSEQSLLRLIGKKKAVKRAVLEAVIDPSQGFSRPAVYVAGLLRIMPKICVIEVKLRNNARRQGTGFLIGAQTVLTAGHVIEPLIDRQTRLPLPDSSQRLRVEFDYVDPLDGGSSRQGVRVYKVVEDWLEEYSPCHDSERQSGQGLRDQDLDATAICDDYLDFAVIRLNGSPGRDRGVVKLDAPSLTDSDIQNLKLTLFQHPQNSSQRFAEGPLVGFFGNGHPRPRLRHKANSTAGSSGGLCVNADFAGVGLHQAAIVNGRGKAICNQAVPTALIAPKLARAFDVRPELDPLWRLQGSDHPVLGREGLQRAIWRAARGEARIITVAGARGSGRSFSTKILRSLIPAAEAVFLEITADEVGHDARSLAELLLKRGGGKLPAGEDWPDEARAGTTSEAWVRDQLAPALARHLGHAASGRAVWLIVDQLDEHRVPEGTAYSLLLALMAAEIDATFMRFMLLGVTDRLVGVDYLRVAEDRTYPPQPQEVEAYIRRRAIQDELDMSPDECQRVAWMIVKGVDGPKAWEGAVRMLTNALFDRDKERA